ncbi:hypothetical protein Lal_00000289 [Lupinus albus]|uniref:Uncharacterized protein n=1 Tax=Lupinus albus TaxID=3870 RepID=A0A6A5LP45_LUPAL|nr:putative protein Networked (NET), actin-binding (NAB) [Lupinus albus]KAF1860875.1 hypothetical protein Lal_00000289 [Lupinus albus]
MATLSRANSNQMYSWWWDSHISPKNSKWLQENLTDMDSKVKQMIKLIEEDADSFARRAEMYYKKRPELMKMVEEFYRAYRALAERYDHATGVIRDAHRTMSEAFPNQIPTMDETEAEPHTPDVRHPSSAFLEKDELQKDASIHFPSMKRIGAHTEEPDSAMNKTGSKQLVDHVTTGEHVNVAKFDGGHARRGLNFIGTQESKGINNGSHDSRAQVLSERMKKAETEILALKKALAKLETEKEAGLLQYQQSLERLSNLELELSHAREKCQGLDERSSKAEAEVQALKQALTILQAETEVSLNQYQECLEKISNLEKNISFAQKDARKLNERATRSESEAESLKQDLARVEAERDAALVQYKQCLESSSKLEERLEEAEEKARRINEQADKAESEIEALKLEVAKLTEEKDDAAVHYEQCLEIISSLEHKLSCAENEACRLNSKVDDADEKLRSSEQKCLQLETSNHTLQSELQSLAQNLASQNEELTEKQRELGTLWISLQYERLRFIEAMIEDVGSTGFDLKCFGASVKQFQDDNSKLKETCKADKGEKASLLEKPEIMEKLLEKNYVLENSISNLNAEMESIRGKLKVLEETCQSLVEEKSSLTSEKATLFSQLQASAEKLERRSENNNLLENSLFDVNAEHDGLRMKSNIFEDRWQLLDDEKSSIISEKETLLSQLNITQQTLKDLEKQHSELELKHLELKGERESAPQKVEKLLLLLYSEREEHSRVMKLNEDDLDEKELQINTLQEDVSSHKKEYEEELDRAVHAQTEIFILQKCIQDLEENNFSLLVECQRLLEASKISERMISKLNNDPEGRLKIMACKLEEAEMENSHLKESFISLNVELKLVESVNDQLSCQIRTEKELLSQKENELLEATIMFCALQTEKTELQRKVEDLKIKYDEAKGILEDQANQILKFSLDKDRQNDELQCLCEVNQKLESEMRHLHQELGETKLREKELSYELHKGTNEIEQWETQAAALYAELLISSVTETLFEGKVSELAYACENVENRNYSKEMEIELLKETVSKLEGENGKLHGHLAVYVPAVSALNDCITSLEMHTLVHARPHEYEESKVQDLVNHQYTENSRQTGEDHTVMAPDALLNFQDMQRRIHAIEMAVKQINFEPNDEIREAKRQQHGSIDEFEVLPKDIMLDQISECSHGKSMRRTLEADDQMLELWETTDKDDIIEVDKIPEMAQRGATEEWKNKYSSSEFLVEKELSVDKLEISGRLTQPHEDGDKSKVLEMLDSDAQKLTNLQITIQELMKVKITETGKKGKHVEYDSVKDQLEAAQETIRKLFEANHKLKKNVEEGRMSFDEKAALESGETGSVSRRRGMEHARRRSAEKLGCLQLDVKRLLFVLLKEGGVKDSKEKAKVADHRSPRVLLRDYFYGGIRTNKEKKKAKFCACIKPSTMEN